MDLIQSVTKKAESITDSKGLDLVDIELYRAGKRLVVRVFIGKRDGVSINDCSSVSRELGTVLDAENVIEDAYTLEVSSPGLDRPFKTLQDWKRNIGREVRVSCRMPAGEPNLFLGILESVDDTEVHLKVEDTVKHIPLNQVALARLEISV